MIRITINIRPVTNNTVMETKTEEKKADKKAMWIKIATWAGAIAATIACANDTIEILTKIGLL